MQQLIEDALSNINEKEIHAAQQQSTLTTQEMSAVLWPAQC